MSSYPDVKQGNREYVDTATARYSTHDRRTLRSTNITMAETFKMLISISYIHSVKDGAVILEGAIRSSERTGMVNLTRKETKQQRIKQSYAPILLRMLCRV